MTVAVVLDSSAALSFSMGARPVGEVLGALFEAPGLRFAVPAVCLAEDLRSDIWLIDSKRGTK